MIGKVINFSARGYIHHRYKRIQSMIDTPFKLQEKMLRNIIKKGKETAFGKLYLEGVEDYEGFRKQLPVFTYDEIKPFFQKTLQGEDAVSWPDRIKWFSKSSGTSTDKSKLVPVSHTYMIDGHLQGGKDTLSCYIQSHPDTKIFEGKSLIMGGTYEEHNVNGKKLKIGDVSAIMLELMPAYAKFFYTPNFETAFEADWEKKIEEMALEVIHDDVRFMGGVPTWSIVLFDKILEITQKQHLLEVWPDFELYIHGGVSFLPYIEKFKKYFPSEKVCYREVYNASEGYFAATLSDDDDDMLLLLDNGVFYEFIPLNDYNQGGRVCVDLREVELDRSYVMVITSTNGNWRYIVGDVVVFTSLSPFKIKIEGRISQYINAFGEELMVHQAEEGIDYAARDTNSTIIEFEKLPENMDAFIHSLDSKLKELNSDYEAKRYLDLAMTTPIVRAASSDTFLKWLDSQGKVGGQSKIPRLCNDRRCLEAILSFS